jgi:oligo-1,6-glucosidase/alpha-glucosidase
MNNYNKKTKFVNIVYIFTIYIFAIFVETIPSDSIPGNHSTGNDSWDRIESLVGSRRFSAMTSTLRWWQKTAIYQIYPRSYQDTNRDGIGDLRGIISRLDYVKDLGFETIWISPFFSSPQGDFGYDVSDYYGIAPEYGALADAEALIEAVHKRGMRILFDLVMNHTSIQHPWFQASRSGRDDSKRDWYIWRDGKGQRPPNNWTAIPGGPGWHYDALTDQYYFASFLPFQPDLNYHNPAVKEAMFDVIRYWLEKGVDGFRLDIFHSIYKDEQFRDNPFSLHIMPAADMKGGFFQRWAYNLNQPQAFELARELRNLIDEYSPDRMLLGELFGDDDTLKQYLGEGLDGLNLLFLWDLMKLKMDASFFRKAIDHYETGYPPPYTPVVVFGNHDTKRVISRVGEDARKAKLLALFQFTVRGVPVVYYGEEIGMVDKSLPRKTALDPMGRRFPCAPQFLLSWLDVYLNRDGCRTPMQWDHGDNAGFCEGGVGPWLPIHENSQSINVKSELADEDSMLHVYKRLLHLRKGSKALQEGVIHLMAEPGIGKDILAYRRENENEIILVLINFGKKPSEFDNRTTCRNIMFEVGFDGPIGVERIKLPPCSGVVLGNH